MEVIIAIANEPNEMKEKCSLPVINSSKHYIFKQYFVVILEAELLSKGIKKQAQVILAINWHDPISDLSYFHESKC